MKTFFFKRQVGHHIYMSMESSYCPRHKNKINKQVAVLILEDKLKEFDLHLLKELSGYVELDSWRW